MPLALAGSLTAVQICYPADLSLILTKNPSFRSGTNYPDYFVHIDIIFHEKFELRIMGYILYVEKE